VWGPRRGAARAPQEAYGAIILYTRAAVPL
jgi:hypothetical protein